MTVSKFTPEANLLYGIFGLPKTFSIDKELLRRRYYLVSRQNHPDITSSPELDAHTINRAFSTLNNDISRAKLFTRPSESISQEFLSHCLDLEERIRGGADLKDVIVGKIEECKKHHDDPAWVCMWGYYQRLLNIAEEQPKQ